MAGSRCTHQSLYAGTRQYIWRRPNHARLRSANKHEAQSTYKAVVQRHSLVPVRSTRPNVTCIRLWVKRR